jgi:hypothetical protein
MTVALCTQLGREVAMRLPSNQVSTWVSITLVKYDRYPKPS